MKPIKILAISGSLRKHSYNSSVINALRYLAPGHVDIVVFDGIGDIPLFNPDRENEDIPAVSHLRDELADADGVIIASPEYARGISGVLKNALDWLVGGDLFVDMPVALINTSQRSTYAQAALRDVLFTMAGVVIEDASVTVPLLGTELDAEKIAKNTAISSSLSNALAAFISEIAEDPAYPHV